MINTPKRNLAAIVGVVAAAGLLSFTPKFEGTKLKTYRDVGGVLTYCTGATENAIFGKTYTIEECKAQLDHDLAEHAEGVMSCTHVPLTDGQKIAFVDFAYNVGVGAYCNGSVARHANHNDMTGACNALLMYSYAGGKQYPGLLRRREAERVLCLGQ